MENTGDVSRPNTLLSDLRAAALERLGPEIETLKLERAVLGIFFTGVKLSNGAGGMCATPVKTVPEAVCCPSSANAMPTPGKISGLGVKQVLEDLRRPQGLRRGLAIATLNAVAETLWLRDGPPADTEPLEGDAFDALKLEPGQSVALVGAFPPYLRELRRRNQPFKVLELDPTTLKPEELPYYVPAERAAEVLPFVDVFITTGTTLINDTLDGLLQQLRPETQSAIIGPTTTLIAGPFARRNVTIIGGTRVKAPDELLGLLAEGGSGYHFFDKTVERVTLRLSSET
ncbi:MAG: DUF364 domain-containing protein [Betaproteobacteria bacterium]|nr:DUF364 domain-containing protein [Betaproteobacteria bacterium]